MSPPEAAPLPAFQFGNTPELADRLAALVISGRKTASCFAAAHVEKITRDGERWVALSSAGAPLAVIETVSTTRLPFTAVTPAMAALEGEGDLSHAYWARAHEAYFKGEGTWSPDMEIYFEIFRVVEILDTSFAETVAVHVAAEIANGAGA